jgi:predicted  nucleic acid-binding Zn-ribbon protein
MEFARELLELQDIDISLHRNEAALKQIPEASQILDVRSRLKELERRSTRIVGLLKDQQMDLDDGHRQHEELIQRCNDIRRSNESADYRRVKNNNAELDRIAKRLEKLEFNEAKANAEIERLHGLQEKSASVKQALEQRELELLRTFKAKAQSLRDESVQLKQRREELVSVLPESLLKAYEKSCSLHGGIGVSHIEDGACSGCGVELQTSQIDDLRLGNDISTCPVCGRILVVRS